MYNIMWPPSHINMEFYAYLCELQLYRFLNAQILKKHEVMHKNQLHGRYHNINNTILTELVHKLNILRK